MKDNISDFPGYYVTVDGKVYSRKNNRLGKRFKVNRTCINRILNKYKALLK